MNQKYRDKLKHYIRMKKLENNQLDDWAERAEICSRRLLAAICFREHSANIFDLTETQIFPNIGFYYSIFHMSVAILSIDYATNLEELKEIHHNTLIKLLLSRLIQRSIIPKFYLDLFLELKDLRVETNYKFIPRINTGIYYSELGEVFDLAIDYIKEISKIIQDEYNLLLRIEINIGDWFGDDILEGFFEAGDYKDILDYLKKKKLTT